MLILKLNLYPEGRRCTCDVSKIFHGVSTTRRHDGVIAGGILFSSRMLLLEHCCFGHGTSNPAGRHCVPTTRSATICIYNVECAGRFWLCTFFCILMQHAIPHNILPERREQKQEKRPSSYGFIRPAAGCGGHEEPQGPKTHRDLCGDDLDEAMRCPQLVPWSAVANFSPLRAGDGRTAYLTQTTSRTFCFLGAKWMIMCAYVNVVSHFSLAPGTLYPHFVPQLHA